MPPSSSPSPSAVGPADSAADTVVDPTADPAADPTAFTRRLTVACFVALIALGLAWEVWLAPLRPGGSMLALKVLPLVVVLPLLRRGHVRTFQWWSMAILLYLTEGLVRATSDKGPSTTLGWIEAALATLAFGAILLHVRRVRQVLQVRQAANVDITSSAARSKIAES